MQRWSPPQAAGTAVHTQPDKALYSTNESLRINLPEWEGRWAGLKKSGASPIER